MAPILHADGRLTPATRAAFLTYCQTWARWVAVEKEIAALEAASGAAPWLAAKPSGLVAVAPLVKLARELSLDLLKIAAECAITPVSQGRVKLRPVFTEDATSEFFE